jgi:hypothetical protein
VNDIEEVEVGYHINQKFQRQGYAAEAARACMEFAFRELGISRIISMIRPENVPSRRVAEKNGLKPAAELFWHGYVHLLYSTNVCGGRLSSIPLFGFILRTTPFSLRWRTKCEKVWDEHSCTGRKHSRNISQHIKRKLFETLGFPSLQPMRAGA